MSMAYADTIVADVVAIEDDDTLGGRIVQAREAASLTTAQLARRLGIKSGTLQGWETDRSEPRSNRPLMLASVLNVSVTWLLVGRGEGPTVEMAAPTIEDMRAMLRQLRQQAQAMTEEIDSIATSLR